MFYNRFYPVVMFLVGRCFLSYLRWSLVYLAGLCFRFVSCVLSSSSFLVLLIHCTSQSHTWSQCACLCCSLYLSRSVSHSVFVDVFCLVFGSIFHVGQVSLHVYMYSTCTCTCICTYVHVHVCLSQCLF